MGRRRHVIAVDVGSCYTRIAHPELGVLAEQPTVVAGKLLGRQSRFRPLAAGYEAIEAVRQQPEGWVARRPLRDGLVTDPSLAAYLVRALVRQAGLRWVLRQPVAVTAITLESPIAERWLADTLREAGFGSVYIVPTVLAAALGSPFTATGTEGVAVVHVGAHRTEVAIVSGGTVQTADSIALGGEGYTDAIIAAVAEECGLKISRSEAEAVKARLGCLRKASAVSLVGIDRGRGLPVSRSVDADRLRARLEPLNAHLGRFVRSVLQDAAVEAAAEVIEHGILLTGGGAVAPGLREAIVQETGLSASFAERPEHAVIRGLAFCAGCPELWNRRLAVRRAA